ncbi:MAG: hypothetical protein ACPGR8_06390 [Limisphaerales bacterium]
MAFREQRANAVRGVVDYTAFVGQGYSTIPRDLVTVDYLGAPVPRFARVAHGRVVAREIKAHPSLHDFGYGTYRLLPDALALLDQAPDLVRERLPPVELSAANLKQRYDGVLAWPYYEDPQSFARVPLRPWTGFQR